MTRKKSIVDIGLLYGQILDSKKPVVEQVTKRVVEEKAAKKLEGFPKATDKKINLAKTMQKGSDKNAFVHKDSGPAAALEGKVKIVDPKITKKDNHYEPEKFSDNTRKLAGENINNHMKSIFDKLYEDVIGDDKLDLGIQAGPEGEAADAKDLDLSGGSEDTVTIKLDKDLAQKLHDALMEVLGGAEDKDDEDKGEEDLGGEEALEAEEAEEKHEDEEEDKKEVAGEATHLEHLPDSKGKSLEKKGGVPTVGTKTGHVKSSKASGQLSTEIDAKGTPIADSKGHSLTSKSAHKANAPGYKAGDFFK
jgi:hypothetical protein